MKALTFRLGQFAFFGLIFTVLFRLVLNQCISTGNGIIISLCAIAYFCSMFFIGWYFGKKDFIENEIHDIGFRWHCTTYLLYNGVNIIAYYVGLNTTNLKAIGFISLFWGIGLLVHFIFFLINQRNSIRGYDKDEIFN